MSKDHYDLDQITKSIQQLDIVNTVVSSLPANKTPSDSASQRSSRSRSSNLSQQSSEFDKPWSRAKFKTAVIYDDFMVKHNCPWIKPDECPERYEVVRDRLAELNLLQQATRLPSRVATKNDVLLVHSEKHFKTIQDTSGVKDVEVLKKVCSKYDGVYMNEHTFDVAMMSLGCAIELTDAIIDDSNQIKNGFAIIRSPGHHAMRDEPNGYCIFNNAAIVAKHAIERRNLKKVLIVDWDIHHGQGTQSLFYNDPNVMYVSIHRYENGKFWPELIESNFNFIGAAQAKGYNINIPLNQTGCNDVDYLLMWFNLIMPVAYEFNPDFVVVSAGYDAAIGCPEGKMRVKPITYSILCHSLMALANGKVVCLLEGGYNLLSLAEGAAMTFRSLLSKPCPRLDERFVEFRQHQSVVQNILSCIWALRPHWSVLQLQGTFERFDPHSPQSKSAGDTDMTIKFAPVAVYEGSNAAYTEQVKEYDVMGVTCPKDMDEQAKLCQEIQAIKRLTDLSEPESRTLLLLDDRMMRHKNAQSHPEQPTRYSEIVSRLDRYGLKSRCQLGTARMATRQELLAVHSEQYINQLAETKTMSNQQLSKLSEKFDSIYINQHSYECALLAAGCVIEAVERVFSGKNSNAFAVVRPPGHHAGADYPAGFCFFNNVVVGGKYALDKHQDKCKKVLIVDYDFHHGDGVQALVRDDERFLYISLHGYNDGCEYPCKTESNFATGSANIVNVPWNDDKMTDAEYIVALFNIVLPIAYEFNPDLVLVSSGFDAAINDPLGMYKVTPAAFGHFVHHLLPLASGKLVACLEGGYNLESISESAAHVVSVLLGDSPSRLEPRAIAFDAFTDKRNSSIKKPSKSALISMKNVVSYHKSNHKLLCMDYDLPSDTVD